MVHRAFVYSKRRAAAGACVSALHLQGGSNGLRVLRVNGFGETNSRCTSNAVSELNESDNVVFSSGKVQQSRLSQQITDFWSMLDYKQDFEYGNDQKFAVTATVKDGIISAEVSAKDPNVNTGDKIMVNVTDDAAGIIFTGHIPKNIIQDGLKQDVEYKYPSQAVTIKSNKRVKKATQTLKKLAIVLGSATTNAVVGDCGQLVGSNKVSPVYIEWLFDSNTQMLQGTLKTHNDDAYLEKHKKLKKLKHYSRAEIEYLDLIFPKLNALRSKKMEYREDKFNFESSESLIRLSSDELKLLQEKQDLYLGRRSNYYDINHGIFKVREAAKAKVD